MEPSSKRDYDTYRLNAIVENAVDGILTLDKDFIIQTWNPAAKRMFGYVAEEIIGTSVQKIIVTPSTLRNDEYIAKYLRSGQPRIIGLSHEEIMGLRKNGSTFPIDMGVSEFQLNGERIYSMILRDISELKRITEDLRKAVDSAKAANQAKSMFLAHMSHEIRTPLGALIGFSKLIVDPTVSPSDKLNYVAGIERNGDLLLNIINDILDISKIEAGKLDIDLKEVAIDEILSDLTALLEIKAKEKGLGYGLLVSPRVPRIIRTDSTRIRQILFNIVGNAIKFTEHGSIEVKVEFVGNGRPKLMFVVKDTGPGIEAAKHDSLFKMFSQVDDTLRRKIGGTGLGLLLSRNLANLLGGDVVLSESVVGKGSTFTITIDPGSIAWPETPPKIPELKTVKVASSDAANIRLDGCKILLVEDMLDNQIIIKKFLNSAGAQVEIADNGQMALEAAKCKSFDVILMDLQLPVLDGYEATSLLRKSGVKVPIIALTAHAHREEHERCLASGFNDHLVKPIARPRLIEAVSRSRAASSKAGIGALDTGGNSEA